MSDNATNGSTARWIDRVWTVASGLLIVTLAAIAGIWYQNSLRLEEVIANQAHAQKERDTIASNLADRNDRILNKESVQAQFSNIIAHLNDHEQRIRALERMNKARLNLFKITKN